MVFFSPFALGLGCIRVLEDMIIHETGAEPGENFRAALNEVDGRFVFCLVDRLLDFYMLKRCHELFAT